MSIDRIRHIIESGRRLDRDQALELLTSAPMGELMALAHSRRMQRHPEQRVTFVFDTNPNYTNICETQCRFCAFCCSAQDDQAYTLSPEEVAQKVSQAARLGATTVLLQGGHSPEIRLGNWLAYITAIQSAAPEIHIHPSTSAI